MNLFKLIYNKFIFIIIMLLIYSFKIFIPSLLLLLIYKVIIILQFLIFKEIDSLNAFTTTLILSYLFYLHNAKLNRRDAIPLYDLR